MPIRRILTVLAVAVLMSALVVATMAVAWAEPPAGGGDTGCEAGQRNAYSAIGIGAPSTEDPTEWPAPYREQPLGENAQGEGPINGFATSEANTADFRFNAPHDNCR